MGGYPYVSTYLDDQVNRSFAMLLFPSFVMATIVSLLCLRDLRLAIALFIASGLAAGLSLALVPLCGAKFSGLTSIIPTLAFVLTNSGGLHLIRYSLTCIGDPWALIRIGWKPCLISTATTAIGMLSLMRSEFPAIREFGFFCALGVGVAFAFQMTIIPWLLWRLGQRGLSRMASRDFESAWWQRFLGGVHRAAFPIVAASLLIGALSVAGLFRLHAEVEAEALFSEDSEIIQSLLSLEEQMGPLDQVELLLIFDQASQGDFSRRLDFVRAMQIDLASRGDVSIVHSLANYLPSRPRPGKGARAITEMNAYEHVLADRYDLLAQSGLLSSDMESEVWRVMIRVPFTRQVDFEQLKRQVMDATQAFEQTYQQFDSGLTMPRLKFTGKNYLYHTAQRKLLGDLFWNFLLAFAIITPLMIIVLRSFSLGMIAMIPNMAPMMLIFGGMGFLGLPVDIAIAMTASVALGIAVDDTAHFLIRFRDFDGRQGCLEPAMTRSIGQCGPAMFYTTVMSGAGIFVNYFSELYVVSRFAATLSLLLVVALVADVMMLPAILYFVDRWYRRDADSSGSSDSDQAAKSADAFRAAN
jgi:predicted RND superfamily exporter protein